MESKEKSVKEHIKTLFKGDHIYTAEKFAEQIYNHDPVKQQEMLEALFGRLVDLNKTHLEKIQTWKAR